MWEWLSQDRNCNESWHKCPKTNHYLSVSHPSCYVSIRCQWSYVRKLQYNYTYSKSCIQKFRQEIFILVKLIVCHRTCVVLTLPLNLLVYFLRQIQTSKYNDYVSQRWLGTFFTHKKLRPTQFFISNLDCL